MAAPPIRRPGSNKRAQTGLFIGYLLAAAGVLAGLLLLTASVLRPNAFGWARGLALDAQAPVSGTARSGVTGFQNLGTRIGDFWNAPARTAALRGERDRLRRELVRVRATELENRQLKRLLAIRERDGAAVASGRVVGSSFSSARRFAIFSAGRNDGVRPGQPVRAPDGLVGRVLDAGASASRLLLVSDSANVVPVRLLRGGMAALSTGRGDGTVELRPLQVGENPFRRGDIVVTSGTGGIYPPGIPVAFVLSLDDDGAIARPIADPGEATFAIALPVFEPEAVVAAEIAGVPPAP